MSKARKVSFRIIPAHTKTKEVFVRIRMGNGETFTHSETYKRKASAKSSIRSFVAAIQEGRFEVTEEKPSPLGT